MPVTSWSGVADARVDATASSSASCPRATMTTFAPPSTKRSATARPIPIEPPVTTAHCPSNGRSTSPVTALQIAHRDRSLVTVPVSRRRRPRASADARPIGERGLGGPQAEDRGGGEPAGVGPHEQPAGVGAGGEQPGDGAAVAVEGSGLVVDEDAAEGERDGGLRLDDVVRRLVEGERVEPSPRLQRLPGPRRGVEALDARSDHLAGVAPVLREVVEVVEGVGEGVTPAASPAQLEPVHRGDPFDVLAEHPLVAHPLVGDDEDAGVGLLDGGDGAEVIAEGLVDEALTAPVEQQRVLGVVERLVGELHGVVQRHVGEHEMAVETGVVLAERGTGLPGEPQARAGARRVRPERHEGRVRVDQRRGQLAIALVAAAGEQRRRGVDAALAAVGRAHVQPRHAAVVREERLDRRVPQDLAPAPVTTFSQAAM